MATSSPKLTAALSHALSSTPSSHARNDDTAGDAPTATYTLTLQPLFTQGSNTAADTTGEAPSISLLTPILQQSSVHEPLAVVNMDSLMEGFDDTGIKCSSLAGNKDTAGDTPSTSL